MKQAPCHRAAEKHAAHGLIAKSKSRGRIEQEDLMGDDNDKRQHDGTEMFYLDENGKKQDAGLHQEMLGDDKMPWDLDLEKFSTMTPEEQEAYLKSLDDAMLGK